MISTEIKNPRGGKAEWRKVNDCHKQRDDGKTMKVDAILQVECTRGRNRPVMKSWGKPTLKADREREVHERD